MKTQAKGRKDRTIRGYSFSIHLYLVHKVIGNTVSIFPEFRDDYIHLEKIY